MELLTRLLEEGIIKLVIDSRYLLERAVEAINYLKQGHSTGKVVINIETG